MSNGYTNGKGTPEVHQLESAPLLKEFPQLKTHEEVYEYSIKNSEDFWATLARSRLRWSKPFDKVLEGDFHGEVDIKWFSGGELNASVNCIDRHLETHPDKTAIIWEKDEPGQEERTSFRELSVLVNKMGNCLKSVGVKRGDRVAVYVPVSTTAAVAMLACARIGATHAVVFAGFSAEALATRIQDGQIETVIAADQAVRGGKFIELKKTVDQAVAMCPTVKRVLMVRRTGNLVPHSPIDIDLDELMESASDECTPESMNSSDPLFLLYTSGSTGQPKGVVHSTAGYLLHASVSHLLAFNFDPATDVFGCVADIGWMAGHTSSLYGILSHGTTTLIFESTPLYPDPGRYWEMVERLKITHFFGSPTAIRMLIQSGAEYVAKYDRSSLKVLGTAGEPMNREAWEWYSRVVGDNRCPIIDTWWQTETGSVCISPWPSSPGAEILPGMPMRPMYGIEVVLINEDNQIVRENEASGALCIARPWPGMALTLHEAHQRFKETYFNPYPGFYFSGDGAYRTEKGYYKITGRLDDVINVKGHKLGTAEIEAVLTKHQAVAETAAVGYPHHIKGQGIYAFVVLKNGHSACAAQILTEAKDLVRRNIATYAIPDYIQICSGLPKTRSGKIMRRILRKIAANELDNFGDTSTLAEPSVVDDIVKGVLIK